jgi:hypothetical protein
MAQGEKQFRRELLIAQAMLFTFSGGVEELEDFIHTGTLGASDGRQVAPCNTMALEAMQRAAEKRRGRQG